MPNITHRAALRQWFCQPTAKSQRRTDSRSARTRHWARVDGRREARADVLLTARGAADRVRKVTHRSVLEHVANRAEVDRPLHACRAVLHAHHDDLGGGHLHTQAADRVPGRATGHAQIEQQHVRRVTEDFTGRGEHVARLGNHVEIGLSVQQEPQVAARRLVVVGQHDPDRGARQRCGSHGRGHGNSFGPRAREIVPANPMTSCGRPERSARTNRRCAGFQPARRVAMHGAAAGEYAAHPSYEHVFGPGFLG